MVKSSWPGRVCSRLLVCAPHARSAVATGRAVAAHSQVKYSELRDTAMEAARAGAEVRQLRRCLWRHCARRLAWSAVPAREREHTNELMLQLADAEHMGVSSPMRSCWPLAGSGRHLASRAAHARAHARRRLRAHRAQPGLQVVRDALDKPMSIEYKGATDLVTDTDKASERACLQAIRARFRGHALLGEEGGITGDTASGYLWCIDPCALPCLLPCARCGAAVVRSS